MRAVLILAVLAAWAACIVGAVGLTAYLAVVATSRLRGADRRDEPAGAPPPRGIVIVCAVFAVAMAALAAALAASVLSGPTPGGIGSALAWAALPSWAAVAATATAVILGRRRAQVTDVHATSA